MAGLNPTSLRQQCARCTLWFRAPVTAPQLTPSPAAKHACIRVVEPGARVYARGVRARCVCVWFHPRPSVDVWGPWGLGALPRRRPNHAQVLFPIGCFVVAECTIGWRRAEPDWARGSGGAGWWCRSGTAEAISKRAKGEARVLHCDCLPLPPPEGDGC